MQIHENNLDIIISEFNEDNHFEQLIEVMKLFLNKNKTLVFGITTNFYEFLCSGKCKNSNMFDFDAKEFVENRIVKATVGKVFNEDNIANNVEMIWIKISNENELSKAINLENLFISYIFSANQEFVEYDYLLYHVETIDNYSLIIKRNNTLQDNSELLKDLSLICTGANLFSKTRSE
ncbi:hypothetical protein [Paenibacillus fonticola]|uniref:hypothetical protein n=1 Tax=Paenibacillus fonticola TaxID=379896 RepID=UPI000377C93E|nr:hypothetical protein [Paenibacillus fonticola]